MRTRSRIAVILIALLAASCASHSKSAPSSASTDDARMAWWREARFGLFIHWGLYAIPAGEWKGGTDHAEWIRTTAQIPLEEYDRFVPQWNPVKFDADAWARAAKDAGMKYVVITSKHHDGFCLFDSKWTEFDVMSTPFRRDVMKELSEACRRHGLRMCWYHSIMDWHHPDYLPRRDWEKTRSTAGADFQRFREYLHHGVEELLTKYGPIGVMWFDGEWESTWTNAYGKELYALCRRLQPSVIVNNRVSTGRSGMAGMTKDPSFPGDFGTPEQEIPASGLPGVDWETCMTMNDHWGWNKNDHHWKPTKDLVRMLADIASKGGNFLLNIGPTAEGEFPPESLERLRAIGAWMRTNGESIHGTTASPFASLPWGRCTMREGRDTTRLYLHVFDWPADGKLVVPGLGNLTLRAHLLADPQAAVGFRRVSPNVYLSLPMKAPDPIDSVVVLEIEGPPIVYEAPTITAPAPIFVDWTDVWLTTRSPEVEIRYTLDGSDPSPGSPIYEKPIRLNATTTVSARSFHRGLRVSEVSRATFTKVEPSLALRVEGTTEGLYGERFEGSFDRLPEFATLTTSSTWTSLGIELRPIPTKEFYAMRLTGFLDVPSDAVYEFALTSDDGSRLRIDEDVVVTNDGLHGIDEKRGVAALGAGLHVIQIEYFNKTGGAELRLDWARAGEKLQPVPPSHLRTK